MSSNNPFSPKRDRGDGFGGVGVGNQGTMSTDQFSDLFSQQQPYPLPSQFQQQQPQHQAFPQGAAGPFAQEVALPTGPHTQSMQHLPQQGMHGAVTSNSNPFDNLFAPVPAPQTQLVPWNGGGEETPDRHSYQGNPMEQRSQLPGHQNLIVPYSTIGGQRQLVVAQDLFSGAPPQVPVAPQGNVGQTSEQSNPFDLYPSMVVSSHGGNGDPSSAGQIVPRDSWGQLALQIRPV
ncbi:unnamed protein product [Discosporangium mesarthrocarpum]